MKNFKQTVTKKKTDLQLIDQLITSFESKRRKGLLVTGNSLVSADYKVFYDQIRYLRGPKPVVFQQRKPREPKKLKTG